MASTRSRASTTRFTRIALAGSLALAAAIAVDGDDVRACVGGDPSIADDTTFDPSVIGKATWPGLFFDSTVAGYGERCDDCLKTAVADDWRGYLGAGIHDNDWAQVLYEAKPAELVALAGHLADPIHAPAPKGFEHSSLWSKQAPADRVRAALDFVQLARQVEAVDSFDGGYDAQYHPLAPHLPAPELVTAARAELAAAPADDAFIRQRFALQVMRTQFYRRDWAAVESQFDTTSAVLLAPSRDLGFRARYYYAGALRHEDKRARANVELARIASDDPALAGPAMRDFQPMEDADWKKALALATTTRDKTLLWRLVGIKADPLTAVREILKLDPKSNLVGLLVVRELARVEAMVTPDGYNAFVKPEPATLAAQKKAYAVLEQLAAGLAAAPATDQPWVMDLVVGHIAARRGDVATARAHLQRALAARPSDVRVVSQAKASLAVALVIDWKIDPAHETELATLMATVDADAEYGRRFTVRAEVRRRLAKAYLAAGKLVEAELLVPGTLVPTEEYTNRPVDADGFGKSKWADPHFIQDMIARLGQTATPFDKFLETSPITRPALEMDLAMRYMLDGDYARSAKTFATTKAVPTKLGVDPFVLHINDCHDCDQAKYANAPWTQATVVDRLGALAKTANGSGEAAADASMQLGTALYNITWFGNARAMLAGSHEETQDTQPAERWFRRAYELTKDRERKAKAAYFAAKCERGRMFEQAPPGDDASDQPEPDLTPTTWYGVLAQYSNTRYYQDVIKECGYFAGWVSGAGRKK